LHVNGQVTLRIDQWNDTFHRKNTVLWSQSNTPPLVFNIFINLFDEKINKKQYTNVLAK